MSRLSSAALAGALVVAAAVPAWAADCPQPHADAALAASGKLRTWPDVYAFFKGYRACDDGGIAEATSDAMAKLLARRWDDVGTLGRLVHEHADFKPFVLSHIDSTADTDDLERLADNAAKRCPAGLAALCSELGAAAKKAME
jgi:hypothetical protein